MNFQLTILGCGAATPTLRRNPSAQLLVIHEKYFLVDCAEATQIQLRRFQVKFQKINHIFISHLHGDHYLGLVGLISSMHLLGRKKELHIYGPAQLEDLIKLNLSVSDTYLNFNWQFHPTNPDEKQLLFEDNTLEVHSFPLKHRIACTGFLFAEKPRKPKMRKELIAELDLDIQSVKALKAGQSVQLKNGEWLSPEQATEPQPLPRKFAYASDTAYMESLIETVNQVDLLYHEATFLETHLKRAKETFHSTASQAAGIAAKAGVRQLVIGHYSARYQDINDFLKEATAVFPNTLLAHDGMTIEIPLSDSM